MQIPAQLMSWNQKTHTTLRPLSRPGLEMPLYFPLRTQMPNLKKSRWIILCGPATEQPQADHRTLTHLCLHISYLQTILPNNSNYLRLEQSCQIDTYPLDYPIKGLFPAKYPHTLSKGTKRLRPPLGIGQTDSGLTPRTLCGSVVSNGSLGGRVVLIRSR